MRLSSVPGKDLEKSTLIQALEKAKVFPSPAKIETRVAEIRATNEGSDPKTLSRQLIKATTRKLTGAGVVAALPGAVPGLGTGTQVLIMGSSVTAETWMILRNLTAMQLSVAGLFGHDVRSEDRKEELVLVWGLETGAILPAKEAGTAIGTKIAIKQFNKRVSGDVFKKINQKLGTTVVTKWGTKRGGIAVGRLIPFGVGTAVGGGMNYATARSFGAALMKYYADLLPTNSQIIIPGNA